MNAPFMREFLNEVQKLRIIEHRDRLTRFQYNFIEKMFNSYGVEIIHIEKNDVSEQEDLVTDIISLMVSFSGKVYGKRSAERRKKKKLLINNGFEIVGDIENRGKFLYLKGLK